MALVDLPDRVERAVEDLLLTLGFAATFGLVLLVAVVPDSLLVGLSSTLSVLGAMAVSAPLGYLLVWTVRTADWVTVEDVAHAVVAASVLFGVGVCLYVALVFAGIAPLP